MNTTSPELLNQIRILKNDQAWNMFVQIYYKSVLRWLRESGTGIADDELEDLAQEVFIVIVRNVHKFERARVGSLRKWIKSIAAFIILKRKSQRSQQSKVIQFDDFDSVEILDSATDEDDRMELVDQAVIMVRKEFAETSWQAFEMVYQQGKKPKQVSEELGLSVNAIYIATSRIIARVRQVTENYIDSGLF